MKNKNLPFEVVVYERVMNHFKTHQLYQSYNKLNINNKWRHCDDF